MHWSFNPLQYNSRMMLTFECDDQNTDGQLSCIPNHCRPHHPDPDPDPNHDHDGLHIPIMTKSHHGGEISVMIKVGMCQCQISTIHDKLQLLQLALVGCSTRPQC